MFGNDQLELSLDSHVIHAVVEGASTVKSSPFPVWTLKIVDGRGLRELQMASWWNVGKVFFFLFLFVCSRETAFRSCFSKSERAVCVSIGCKALAWAWLREIGHAEAHG